MTRAQVRNLEERSAEWVAKHLVMAGRLIDLDPELAFQHALAASRRGGRLAAVREAVGLTAYAAGHYGEALREFRTFRRISGSNVHLPVMADCERGLGRPDRALDLARSEEAESLDAAGKAELAMVVSGARADMGQLEAAVAALEIPQLDLHRAFSFSPRLFRAYADALDAVGRSEESGTWRRQAGVAEKALGLDDDSEPDIIDLGEDDEPAPLPVPRVADVLGGAAAAPGAAPATAVPTAADASGAPTQELNVPAGGSGDAGEPVSAAHEAAVGRAGNSGGSDPEDTVRIGEAGPESEPETAHGGERETEGTHVDGPDAVPADAVPVGETSHTVQALQTEMLFSMDDSGSVDTGPSNEDASGDVRPRSTSPAVEFSEAGSDPAGSGAGAVEQAVEPATTDEPGDVDLRSRASGAEASQEDAVDD